MDKEKEFIKEIYQKQNFEKILLNIKRKHKCKKLTDMFNFLEKNMEIKKTLKRVIYSEIFDYVNDVNRCYEDAIKEVFLLGMQETIKKIYTNYLYSTSEYNEKSKEGNNMEEIEEFIKNIKTNGIIRKLDDLGRLVIPIEYRRDKVIDGETPVNIFNIGDYVIVEILEEKVDKYTKRFDGLGRVVIQIEIRNKLNWNKDDEIKIWDSGKYFVLQKVKSECIFCGKKNDLIEFRNELICEQCKKELKEI